MITAYFGDIRDGRLTRLQFLGYFALIAIIIFGFVIATVLAIGAGEHLIGGDLTAAQDTLRNTLGGPFIIVYAMFLIAIVFMLMNITAKRARDIGLPGWLVVLALVVISFLLSSLISDDASNVFSGLVLLALLLISTDAFKRS